MARTVHARKGKPKHPAELRLDKIRAIMEAVDRRALADSARFGLAARADGAVSAFQDEVTTQELKAIYRLSGGKVR